MVDVLNHPLVLLELEVLLTVDVREAPLARNDDFLATGELVPGAAESLLDNSGVRVLCTDGKDDLADVHTSDGAVWLAPSATHTGLETVFRPQSATYTQSFARRRTDQLLRRTTSC